MEKKQRVWYHPGLLVRKLWRGQVEFQFQLTPGKVFAKERVSAARAWDIARLLDVRDWDSPVQVGLFTSVMDGVLVDATVPPVRIGLARRNQLENWEFKHPLPDEARLALIAFLQAG